MIHEYPYTDYSEINLDWVIKQIMKISGEIDGIEERAVEEALKQSAELVNRELSEIRGEIGAVRSYVDAVKRDIDKQAEEMQKAFAQFITFVNGELLKMSARISKIENDLVSAIVGVNARTDQVIARNNDYIFEQISAGLVDVKVYNYFTGERVSIQDMINYLSALHIDDALLVSAMVERAKTVNYLINLNMSVTDLIMHGNTLYN